jgi:signal transduction histidine kinase
MFELQYTKKTIEKSAVQKELEHINNRLRGAVRELRDVVNNLRPPALLRFGLGKSLRVFVEDFRAKHPELEIELLFDLAEDQIYFPEEVTLSLYRLCQEGLNNVARHAQATRTKLRFSQDEEKILLEIQDNGKGFLVSQDLFRGTQEGHFGLAGMRERVQAIGGEFAIYSSPGSGTTIEVKLNVEQPMQEAILQGLPGLSAV